MADFGKLNFSVAFNPTSAFPLDARSYFTSLALAKAAAATAEETGSSNTVYYFGMLLFVDDGIAPKWYMIKRDRTLMELGENENGNAYLPDGTTIIQSNGKISVNTTDEVKSGSKQPITSGGVYTCVGNVETLLEMI